MSTADEQVIHVWGFDQRGIGAAVVEGTVEDVANRTLDKIQSFGHDVQVSTVRDLSGWLVEVHATVTVGRGGSMWHRFMRPRDPWPMEEAP